MKTEEELRKASIDLFYEIGMFRRLVQGMASRIAGESIVNNALLESFAIHVRNLIYFFYTDVPKKEDDNIAKYYFTEWESVRPSKTEVLEKAYARANKEIAHLTFSRLDVTPEKKQWDFESISIDLNKTIEKFLELVPENLLDPSLKYKNNRIPR